jgi:hypothetical protein
VSLGTASCHKFSENRLYRREVESSTCVGGALTSICLDTKLSVIIQAVFSTVVMGLSLWKVFRVTRKQRGFRGYFEGPDVKLVRIVLFESE